MPEDKPELSELAEALGGESAPQTEGGETPGERKLREDREVFNRVAKEAAEAAPKKDTPKVEEPAPEPEDEVKEETPEPPQDTDEVKKAREFLRLKQTLPPSTIDSLSPDEAIEARRSVARREAEMDRVLEDLAELRKQRDEQEAPKETEHDAVPAVEIDVEAMTARLKETLGEDEAGAVASLLADTVKGALAPLQEALKAAQSELGDIKGVMDSAQEQNTRNISTTNQTRISEHLPQLKDNDAWAAIEREVVHSLNENGTTFSTVEEAFDSVVTRMYGAEALKNGKPDEPEVDEVSRIEASSVTVPQQKKKARKLTAEEQQLAIFKHLEAHDGDIRGARKAARLT